MKGLFFTMELKPYRYGFVCSIGQSRSKLSKSLKGMDKQFDTSRHDEMMKVFDKEADRPGYVHTFEGDCFLRMQVIPNTIDGYGVLIHELLHVTRACLKSRNITMSGMTGQEAYCYLLEELHNSVVARINEHKNA